jgi:hypothetical protein
MEHMAGRMQNRQPYLELFDNHVIEVIQARADFL